MTATLLYGDTVRYPAVRHEIPLEIIDEVLFVEQDGRKHVLTSTLEAERIAAAVHDAELLLFDEVGLFDLVREGMPRKEAELQVVIRALERWRIDSVLVPDDLPVAVADRIRRAGIGLAVEGQAVEQRRRVKNPAELEGIRRAQRAAEAGMAAGEKLIRAAEGREGILCHDDGDPLTAEAVRAAIRAACAEHGAPAPPDIMVVSLHSGGGHDPGSGPLPADLPIEIDLWPRDEASGCWADMTRTFVNGETNPKTLELRDIVREALEATRDAAKPGIGGRELYDVAAEVIERAGFPTRRSAAPGERLASGFYFALGHGVGLQVHEPPYLGLGADDALVAGDVIAIEPGIERVDGVGGVRFEDLLLITEDGSETLTDYPYEL